MSLAAARRDDARTQTSAGAPGRPADRRVLVVDPGTEVCRELADRMRASGPGWRIDVALSGEAALAELAAVPADVVVADERLPEMDGVTLLTRVRDRHPTSIRIILSEAAASQRPSLAAIVAHRLLPRPCDVAELDLAIRRSSALHALTGRAEAYRRTLAAAALPSRPGVYMELNQVLSDPHWEPGQLAAVVEHDVALSAKVLQLANSALFGLSHPVNSVHAAVMYLGAETVRSLALTAEAFGKLTPRRAEGFSIEVFQRHAMLVARIAAEVLPGGRARQDAVTASLLHDIGKLVLIADGSSGWAQLNRRAAAQGLPLHDVEQETEGVTHADIGAHLLSLWGLPDGIVEAVAHHHRAGSVEGPALDAVAAVHIADALARELDPVEPDARLPAPPPAVLDEALVDRLGLRPRLDGWRQSARRLADTTGGPEAVPR